ncbi:hypothetical protein ACT7DH_15310 [Bacillus pacificus]
MDALLIFDNVFVPWERVLHFKYNPGAKFGKYKIRYSFLSSFSLSLSYSTITNKAEFIITAIALKLLKQFGSHLFACSRKNLEN